MRKYAGHEFTDLLREVCDPRQLVSDELNVSHQVDRIFRFVVSAGADSTTNTPMQN